MSVCADREDPFAPQEEEEEATPPASTTAAPTTLSPTAANMTESYNITFDPLSLSRGVCRDVVSGIHLEVMYAQTGSNKKYPLLEIIGAAVRYGND